MNFITQEYETRPEWAKEFVELVVAMQRLADIADPLDRREFVDLVAAIAAGLWMQDGSRECCSERKELKWPDTSLFPVSVKRLSVPEAERPEWGVRYLCHRCGASFVWSYKGDGLF